MFAIKESKEYAIDITEDDDNNFAYLVEIPQDRFVPVFKYRCNADLCPVPLVSRTTVNLDFFAVWSSPQLIAVLIHTLHAVSA